MIKDLSRHAAPLSRNDQGQVTRGLDINVEIIMGEAILTQITVALRKEEPESYRERN